MTPTLHVPRCLRPQALATVVASIVASAPAQALDLTTLPGVTASASACYTGCGGAHSDAANIIDGDWGQTGNTGLNSWNSGGYGGWVQLDLGAAHVLDRVELYGWHGYYNPYTLSTSADGQHWTTLAVGGYHAEPQLSMLPQGGQKYGAVHDVALGSLAAGVEGRYLRYAVNGGSPHWAYLFEMQVQGHAAPVPEPSAALMAMAGLAALGWLARRRRGN